MNNKTITLHKQTTDIYVRFRIGLAWFRLGFWKLRGKRRDVEKGRWPLSDEDENVVRMLIKCKETQRWQEQFLDNKGLRINEEITHKKIISFNKITKLKNVGTSLHIAKGKWQNPVVTSYIRRCKQNSTNIFEFQFDVRFKIFMAMPTNIMVFWDVIPFSLADTYQRFKGIAMSVYRREDFSFFLTMTYITLSTTYCVYVFHMSSSI